MIFSNHEKGDGISKLTNQRRRKGLQRCNENGKGGGIDEKVKERTH